MTIWRLSLALLLLALFSTTTEEAIATESRVVVITSSSFDPGAIPINTLRAIFMMRMARWTDGTPVKVYVFSDSSPEHEAFSKEILQFFPRQLRLAWDRQVFSGLGQYPEQVDSAQEMISKVIATPGSVGYISKKEVNEDVRILQIQP